MLKTKKKVAFGNSFQKAITASFIRMPEFFGRFRDLINERVIDDPDLGSVVTVTREITEKTGGALPTRASLEHKLPKLKMLIKDLYMTDVRDREFVADEVAKFCRMQAFKDALVNGANKLKALKAGTGKETAMSEAMAVMQDALMVGMDVSDIGEFLLEGKEDRQSDYLHPEIVKRIPTGLKHFDECLGGGLGVGELGIIMSPPKCGKCQDFSSKIWCQSRGYVTLQEIFDGYSPNLIGVTEKYEVKSNKVLERIDSGMRRMTEIKLRSGSVISTMATTHPVMTMRGFVQAKDLKVGDITIGPKYLRLSGKCSKEEVDWAYFLGVLTGDGSGNGKTNMALHMNDTDKIDVMEKIKKIMPRSCRPISSAMREEGSHGICYRFRSTLNERLRQRGYEFDRSVNKTIPRSIFEKGSVALAAFIAGLTDTDGGVLHAKNGCCSVEWRLGGIELANQLQDALKVFGITVHIRNKTIRLKGYSKKYKARIVTIMSEEGIRSFIENVVPHMANKSKIDKLVDRPVIDGQRGMFQDRIPNMYPRIAKAIFSNPNLNFAELYRRFNKEKGQTGRTDHYTKRYVERNSRMSVPHARIAAEYIGDPWMASLARGEFVFDEVTGIKLTDRRPCGDISTIKGIETFVSEGVFTHNSSMLMNFGFGAANSLNRYKVVHYSLEMAQRKILKRYDMRIAGSCSDSLKTDPQTFVDGMDNRIGKMVGGNVLVKSYPTRSAGYSTICSHLSRVKSLGFSPNLLIVDYLQIMKPERRIGEQHQEIASCAEDLRRIAGEFNVGCWTAQQVNRGGMLKARPGMADASGAIETTHIADVFAILAQSPEERQQKLARLVMEALREEASGAVIKIFDDRARMLMKTLEIVKESVKEKKKDDPEDKDAARLEKARKLAKAMRS